MIALDEDSLICDFAEYYRIYNIYSYPVEYIATLANGLRNNSRIKLKEKGLEVDIYMLLLAHLVDNTAFNIYAKTKDARSGKNKPHSFVEMFFTKKEEKNKEEAVRFETGADFDKEWSRLNGNRTR